MQKTDSSSTPQTLGRLFPNIVTLMALCAGISSIRFALIERWEWAVACIVIAALIDGIDGRLARLLKATSNFGAQLDSLVDFANFGLAPALVLYLWKIDNTSIQQAGWACVLLYCICCAIRLARFNTNLDDDARPEWMDMFFSGVPSTAGAVIVLVPMMLSFHDPALGRYFTPSVTVLYMICVGLLLAGRIPMFSGKKIAIRKAYTSLTLVVVSVGIVCVWMQPWFMLPLIALLYVLSLPWSCFSFMRQKKQLCAQQKPASKIHQE